MIEIVARAGPLYPPRKVAVDDGIGGPRDHVDTTQKSRAQEEPAADAQQQNNTQRGCQDAEQRFLQLADLLQILANSQPKSAIELPYEDANMLVLLTLLHRPIRAGIVFHPAQTIGTGREIAGKALAGRINNKIVESALDARALLHLGDQAIDATRAKFLLEQHHLGFDAARQLLLESSTRAPERGRAQQQHASAEQDRVERRQPEGCGPKESRQGHVTGIQSRARFPGAPPRSPGRSWRAAG